MIQKTVFENSIAAAHEICRNIIKLTGNSPEQIVHIAVSGGTTPATLFRIWKEQYARLIPWSRIHIYWVDERCVDPKHPDSNYGMAMQIIEGYVDIPAQNIHRMIGEAEPNAEAERYGNLLKELLPIKNNLPCFDLILLGIGDDGHTASIFPDNPALLQSSDCCAVAYHPVTLQKRISLTGPVISNASEIIFYVTGASKRNIIQQIINQDEHASRYPSYQIAHRANFVRFYLDKDSAELICK